MTRERRRFRAVTLALLPALALVVVLPPGASSQGTLSALQTDVDQIARAAHASVVTVYAENTVNSVRRRSQVRQRLRTRVGSGVAVEEFVIVTTASVVVGAERLWVRTTNGLRAEAQLAGLDQGEFGPSSMPRGGYDSDPAPAGMSFVIPVDVLRPIYEGLRAEGRLHYGYLGVSTRDASVESDTEKGLRVPIGAEVEGVQ